MNSGVEEPLARLEGAEQSSIVHGLVKMADEEIDGAAAGSGTGARLVAGAEARVGRRGNGRTRSDSLSRIQR